MELKLGVREEEVEVVVVIGTGMTPVVERLVLVCGEVVAMLLFVLVRSVALAARRILRNEGGGEEWCG